MKANYKREPTVKKSNIEAVVRSEFNKQLDNVYNEVKNDIAAQLMAVCCHALHSSFDFGAKRLRRFTDEVENLFEIMLNKGIFGKPFTTENCIEYMKNEFGIDFDEEIIIRPKEREK